MKLNRFGTAAALLATTALFGCSSGQKEATNEQGAQIGFHLLANNGVVITSANYQLNTQDTPPKDVIDGSVPVPNDDSVITLGVRSLGAGAYSLAFSATGMYQGKSVPCVSDPVKFNLTTGQQLTLPDITLTCTITNQVDNSSGIDANVTVAVQTITVGSVIETFTYGPRSVIGHADLSGTCNYPPVALKIANSNPAVHYTWAATPDGTLALNANNTVGTYQCVSGGSKTLTLTGTDGTTTSTKSVTVTCDDSVCASGAVCGDHVVQTGEQCDEATARCTNCKITPVCGDGVTDAPEACDAINLPTATCDTNCHSITPISCGDGIKNGTEQCDNGTANSDTAPNACRTNCTNPKCGDGVADTGEACDSGTANSDTVANACRTTCTAPKCGDGVVDTGEQCDAAVLPTASCDATCKTIQAAKHTACISCLGTSANEGDFQVSSCNNSPACLATEACVIDSGCFSPVSLFCFCGTNGGATTDLDAYITKCDNPATVANGPCVDVIKTGFPLVSSNSDIDTAYFDFTQPSGVAMLLVSSVLNTQSGDALECNSLCK